MKILIAEDDAVSRRLLERKLVMWGYQVITCSSGTEAQQVLEREDSPKLAILNWMMPGVDGVQICREVRKQQRKDYIYIVLLTARDQKEDIVEGIEAGADDYVTKPFNPHELKVRVRAGRRILDMHNELMQREKLLGVVEMAGATCHEFNQPMQVISGYTELVLKQVPQSGTLHDEMLKIKDATETMAQITSKLQSITRYETREYFDGIKIIDIDKASRVGPDETAEKQPTPELTPSLPTCGWRS